jgi:hypothetical protein
MVEVPVGDTLDLLCSFVEVRVCKLLLQCKELRCKRVLLDVAVRCCM